MDRRDRMGMVDYKNPYHCPLLTEAPPWPTSSNRHNSFARTFLLRCFPLSNLEVQLRSEEIDEKD